MSWYQRCKEFVVVFLTGRVPMFTQDTTDKILKAQDAMASVELAAEDVAAKETSLEEAQKEHEDAVTRKVSETQDAYEKAKDAVEAVATELQVKVTVQ